MKNIFLYLVFVVIAVVGCKTQNVKKRKPEWVQQRPTNEMFYVGIGIASKANNPFDFQQVAKKNAVNDLISEIKVTVSSHSLLSQYQNNKTFSQQFESDVKVTALNTIEQFNIIDSWEDQNFFWIYYRLSKEEYKAEQRRKMEAAIQQAENHFYRAEAMNESQYTQSIRLKVKALTALQLYLNEDLQTIYNGKEVYLVTEIVNSIQNQFYNISLKSEVNALNGKVGKPIPEPFAVSVKTITTQQFIPFLPLTMYNENGKIEGTLATESDQGGIAKFAISKIANKAPIQIVKITTDMKAFIKADSISETLRAILLSIDMPSTSVRLNVVPIKILSQSDEQNLSKPLSANYIESALKKQLIDDGCIFVENKEEADYILRIQANTKPQGNIWGNMRTASLNVNISLIDQTNNTEVYKDGLREIKGFQTSDENAGIDAFQTGSQQILNRLYPALKLELMRNK